MSQERPKDLVERDYPRLGSPTRLSETDEQQDATVLPDEQLRAAFLAVKSPRGPRGLFMSLFPPAVRRPYESFSTAPAVALAKAIGYWTVS